MSGTRAGDLVLVVDDDPTLRLLARETLEAAGFGVSVAEDGLSAVAMCEHLAPDIVLLDVQLPGMDGFGVCTALCERLEGNPIPVLMMTALDDADSIHRAYEAGATDFITKPINWTLLPHRVHYLLRASRTLEALRISQARLDHAQRIARLGHWELDLQGETWYWSDAMYRLLDVAPESAPSLEMLRRAVHPEDRSGVETALDEACRHARPYRADYRLLLADGQSRVFHEQTEVIVGNEGRPLQIVGTVQDITERVQLEAQLTQLHKMEALGLLAGGIAHDFNNLLTVILGNTEMVAMQMAEDNKPRRQLQQVLAAGTRAKDLVQQILTFSRRTPPQRRPIRLHDVVTEALRFLRASCPSTIEIRHALDPSVGTVLADPTQVHQVLLNLGTNAVHAMRETGGVLEMGLEAVDVDAAFAPSRELKPGRHVRLTVSDSGYGMTPEVMERIFDPFFTTKPAGEGTGMGLAVIQGIVTNHGGAITVKSAPGRGATFEVYLPQVDMPVEEPSTPATAATGGARRILLVDDEVAVAQVGQEILRALGYAVRACTNPVEALEIFRAAPQHFDLVITDQTMPAMTGDKLVPELRRVRPDIPLILCTGYSHTLSEEQARAIGVDAYLLKPLLAADYDRAIRQALEASRCERSPRAAGSYANQY
jgi:PAS domain S-box-containing protein